MWGDSRINYNGGTKTMNLEKAQKELEAEEAFQEQMSEDMTEDQAETQAEASTMAQQSFMQDQELDKYGQHSFIRDTTLHLPSVKRATFFSESEKGRPLFSAMFVGDMINFAEHYLDDMSEDLKVQNKIAIYFTKKLNNMADLGLSNKGFIQNLNTSRRILSEKKKFKPIEPKKDGG